MAIETTFPVPDSRREALYNYLIHYLLENDGKPPTMREIKDAKVGRGTKAGPMTSTSVIKANLTAMTRAGWIRHQEGGSRGTSLVGGYYVVASNVLHHMRLTDYRAFLIDESAGIYAPVNPEVRELLELVASDETMRAYTYTHDMERRGNPDVWEGLEDEMWHISTTMFIQALTTPIESWETDGVVAVITSNEEQAALAAAAGMGVFDPGNEDEWEQQTNGQRPST